MLACFLTKEHIEKNHGAKRTTAFVEVDHDIEALCNKMRIKSLTMQEAKAKGTTSFSVELDPEKEPSPSIFLVQLLPRESHF